MLKLKKTFASLVLFTQIILYIHLAQVHLYEHIPIICHWVLTIFLGPLEYIIVFQMDWAPHLAPFAYAVTTLILYAFYTWIIENLGYSWAYIIYATHIGWIIFRIIIPMEYLTVEFGSLVAKLF